ncbi:MAG TPA: rod shape-determining protein MreC [Gemmatimonadaceae bacterium]|nr:rod shape-determining protein MreC [Gemmatimonadaceae bacterium]
MARGGVGAARLSGRLDTVVLAACIVFALVASALPVQMRDPVASGLRRTVVAPLVGLQQSAERWRAAWLESERKILERDSLALQLVQARALNVENDRLRKMLGLGARLGWGFVPAEALHTSGRAEDVITTLTLTAGTSAGVAQYSPVVAPEGIVGLVQTVDPTMSIAILYSHPDFRVSAMSADGSAFGIVYPHLDVRPGRLAERYLLELRNVPFRSTLKPGTAIFSSGLGGAWPRGVLIGTVVDEVKEAESWSRTYLLQPAVNPTNVTSVMILTPKRSAEGVGNIWANAAQVQSALKTIVAAGDSLARQAAIAEAAARRVALDSLRRAGVGDSLAVDTTARDTSLIRKQGIAPTRPTTRRTDSAAAAAARDTTRRDSTAIRPDSVAERP